MRSTNIIFLYVHSWDTIESALSGAVAGREGSGRMFGEGGREGRRLGWYRVEMEWVAGEGNPLGELLELALA